MAAVNHAGGGNGFGGEAGGSRRAAAVGGAGGGGGEEATCGLGTDGFVTMISDSGLGLSVCAGNGLRWGGNGFSMTGAGSCSGLVSGIDVWAGCVTLWGPTIVEVSENTDVPEVLSRLGGSGLDFSGGDSTIGIFGSEILGTRGWESAREGINAAESAEAKPQFGHTHCVCSGRTSGENAGPSSSPQKVFVRSGAGVTGRLGRSFIDGRPVKISDSLRPACVVSSGGFTPSDCDIMSRMYFSMPPELLAHSSSLGEDVSCGDGGLSSANFLEVTALLVWVSQGNIGFGASVGPGLESGTLYHMSFGGFGYSVGGWNSFLSPSKV
jgi:hypothetical protein